MADQDQSTRQSSGIEEELRQLSCYTTPPARTLELFDEARARCPVAHSDEHDGFELLLTYDDVKAGMVDHELFSSQPQVLRPMLPRKPIPGLEMDPPRHQHWRALYNQAVTARTAEMMEPQVRADINRHIDAFIGRGRAEIIEDLTEPVPAEAICHLVGVDEELVPTVRQLAIEMFAAMGEPEEFGRRQAKFGEVTVGEVHKRQGEPRDDFLTYLANVEVEGRKLDDDDYVVLLAAFLGAGHHSTTSAMSSLIYEVFSSDEMREKLTAEPELIPSAAEEALRLHPPFYGFFRRATEDTEVEGVKIPEGRDVYMGWAAANRDPDIFPEPSRFRLDRGRNRHLTFGFGVHACPGAPLARMELRVLIEELLRRIPDLKIEIDEPIYEFGGGDYAFMVELPVSFAPGVVDTGERVTVAELPSWMVGPEVTPGVETIEMRVAARRTLADGVIELQLTSVGGGKAPGWQPGAHVDLHLPGGMIRQYSLCGDPNSLDSLRVAVLRETDGRGGSRYLHDVTAVGDTLAVGLPRNNFALGPSPRYLFIAGGIGITPLVPMIAQVRGTGAEWSLVYGGRSRDSMAFRDGFEGAREVEIAPEDKVGLLDLAAILAVPREDTLIYCCGPEPLLAAVEEAAAHWPEGALHVERFKARGDLPSVDGHRFEVVLRRSGISLTVEPGETILEAVSAAGVPVPSSCQEGTCGTCETVVLEGEPEHRDSVLTPADRAAGDCMMICCSRARGSKLVLDL